MESRIGHRRAHIQNHDHTQIVVNADEGVDDRDQHQCDIALIDRGTEQIKLPHETRGGSRQEDVAVALADAIQDSLNYADLIQRNATLEARRDTVAEKVNIIQEIDALRYVWPHLLDEVARALPDYTWLTQVIQVSVGETVDFQVRGMAGNNQAMTTFWRQLEESPFIRSVQLVQSEQVVQATGQLVYAFQLDCVYGRPSLDVLETIPLFGVDGSPVFNE